jgi:hypothetical protein
MVSAQDQNARYHVTVGLKDLLTVCMESFFSSTSSLRFQDHERPTPFDHKCPNEECAV